MKTTTILLIITIFCTTSIYAQDKRLKITEYLNKEIMIEDNFAGQSMTLIKENNEYFILRKFFGSGVPVVGSSKYKVVFNSVYQIAFSEIVESSIIFSEEYLKEEFQITVEDKGPCLYLNKLKVVIKENFFLKSK